MALGLDGSFLMAPALTSAARWEWTVEGEDMPNASPISRTEGGYPLCSTVVRMYSSTWACRSVNSGMSVLPVAFGVEGNP
ncbi:MAG: hypothetical protein KatS3mg011_1424 [Acidimicrobiia bacterium]|nr:MAG: hypothetical protein KatS3mg011_1424 [Acidimicrobiia bacterium]